MNYNRISKLAPLSWRKIARQLDGSVAHALQPAHTGTDRLENAPHLAVAPFPQGDPVPAVGAVAGSFQRDALERSGSVIQMDALLQFFNIYGALHSRQILALDLIAWVHQPIRELAVVGEEQEPGAVQVEPSNGDPSARRKPRKHGRPPLRIAAGHQLAYRLVVQEDSARAPLQFDALAINGDLVCTRGALAEARYATGQSNAACLDP